MEVPSIEPGIVQVEVATRGRYARRAHEHEVLRVRGADGGVAELGVAYHAHSEGE